MPNQMSKGFLIEHGLISVLAGRFPGGTAPTNFFRETPEKNGFSARANPQGVASRHSNQLAIN